MSNNSALDTVRFSFPTNISAQKQALGNADAIGEFWSHAKSLALIEAAISTEMSLCLPFAKQIASGLSVNFVRG